MRSEASSAPKSQGHEAEHPSEQEEGPRASSWGRRGSVAPLAVAGRPVRGSLGGIKAVPHSCLGGEKRKREEKKKMKGSAGFSCKFSPGSALCARSPFERGLEGGYSPAPTPRSPPLFQPPCGGELENPKESLENAGSPIPVPSRDQLLNPNFLLLLETKRFRGKQNARCGGGFFPAFLTPGMGCCCCGYLPSHACRAHSCGWPCSRGGIQSTQSPPK